MKKGISIFYFLVFLVFAVLTIYTGFYENHSRLQQDEVVTSGISNLPIACSIIAAMSLYCLLVMVKGDSIKRG